MCDITCALVVLPQASLLSNQKNIRESLLVSCYKQGYHIAECLAEEALVNFPSETIGITSVNLSEER